MKRLLGALGFSTLLVASTVFAHHGWSEYDSSKPLQLNGTIEESGYSHPHGFIRLKTDDKTWSVVLAPPSRMENRGLSREMLSVGKRATVVVLSESQQPR